MFVSTPQHELFIKTLQAGEPQKGMERSRLIRRLVTSMQTTSWEMLCVHRCNFCPKMSMILIQVW